MNDLEIGIYHSLEEETIDYLESIKLSGFFGQSEHKYVDYAIEAVRRAPLTGNKALTEIKTCDLVRELERREGVETHNAEPYKDLSVSVNGPAVVLVVID